MRLALLDLPGNVNAEALKEALATYAPVLSLDIIRDGNPDEPLVLVEFAATSTRIEQIALSLTDHALLGQRVRAHVMLHE